MSVHFVEMRIAEIWEHEVYLLLRSTGVCDSCRIEHSISCSGFNMKRHTNVYASSTRVVYVRIKGSGCRTPVSLASA